MAADNLKLVMKFETADGKKRNVSIAPCAEELDEETVRDAMDAIIASEVFDYAPSAKLGADIVEHTVTKIF